MERSLFFKVNSEKNVYFLENTKKLLKLKLIMNQLG